MQLARDENLAVVDSFISKLAENQALSMKWEEKKKKKMHSILTNYEKILYKSVHSFLNTQFLAGINGSKNL